MEIDMGLRLSEGEGQTPINEEEKEGLLIRSISTQGELDEFEHFNIEKALEWLIKTKPNPEIVLTEKFIKGLHKRMFGEVWKWAGEFRQSEKNMGIAWINIGIELKILIEDTQYWITNKIYIPEEIAIRFKHKIVSIHCFSNGNGRHSRIMADTIMESVFGEKVFSWHQSNMVKPDQTRKKYIDSLRQADQGNIIPLIEFAKH